MIEKHNNLRIQKEQIEGFEADEIAPPMPVRTQPKKKVRSKKKKAFLKEKSVTEKKAVVLDEGTGTVKRQDKKEEKVAPSVNADIWGKLDK